MSLWRYTEFLTGNKSRNSVKFRGISRNYRTRNSAEFRGILGQCRTEYGIDGSKKNRRNSVSTEFRGHPIPEYPIGAVQNCYENSQFPLGAREETDLEKIPKSKISCQAPFLILCFFRNLVPQCLLRL